METLLIIKVSKENELVDETLLIAQYGMKTSVHMTFGSTPWSLVVKRDKFLKWSINLTDEAYI